MAMFGKNITFMRLLTENVQVKFSKKEKYYLDQISKTYGYKRCQFIRDAVLEKMKRDVPKLRKIKKEQECPF